MTIPAVSRADLEHALTRFDQEFRDSQEWIGWEDNRAHLYALRWDEQLYPAKKVVSLATGMAVSEFSGGSQTNNYLQAHGFEVINLHDSERPASPFEIAFEVGRVYDRRADIHGPFGGSRQSGISASAQAPAIFLFTGESGKQYGYHDSDGYDELGVFHYTGEGQTGDMQLTGGNRAVLHHPQDGRSLHLFRSLGKKAGKSLGQMYLGEFVCADHSWNEGQDKGGVTRKIVVFHLVPVGRVDEVAIDTTSNEPAPMTLVDARRLALQSVVAGEGSGVDSALRNLYKRSARVKNYVLLRAAGRCESCREEAPFRRKDGSPYLEPHHINRLSDGGLDHPRYIGAICPSCHREIHYGENGEVKNNELRQYVDLLESKLAAS